MVAVAGMSGRNHDNRVYEAVLAGRSRYPPAYGRMVRGGQGHPVSVCGRVVRSDRRVGHESAAYDGRHRGSDAVMRRFGTAAVAGTGGGVDDPGHCSRRESNHLGRCVGPGSTWDCYWRWWCSAAGRRITECVASIGLVVASVTYATLARPEIMGYAVPSGINKLRHRVAVRLSGRDVDSAPGTAAHAAEARHQLERARLQLLTSTSLHDSVSATCPGSW